MTRFLCLSAVGVMVIGAALPSFAHKQDQPTEPVKKVTFKKDIKPVLTKYCVKCHGGDTPAAGVNLTDYKKIMKQANGDNKLVSVGEPDKSILVWAVEGSHDIDKMPRGKAPLDKDGNAQPFGDKETALIKAWIKSGAKP